MCWQKFGFNKIIPRNFLVEHLKKKLSIFFNMQASVLGTNPNNQNYNLKKIT